MEEQKFIELFTKAIRTHEVKEILKDSATTAIKETLEETIERLEEQVKTNEEKIESLESRCTKLEEELKTKNNYIEQELKRKNIIIEGLPEDGSNPKAQTLDLLKNLDVEINPVEIDEILKITQVTDENTNTTTRKILLKTTNSGTKDKIYKARTKLKDSKKFPTKIYINEDLTNEKANLFFKTRELVKKKKIKSAWTYKGQIYAKQDEQSTPTRITDNAKLEQFKQWIALSD